METLKQLDARLIARALKLKQAKELIIETKNKFNQHVYTVEKQLDARERHLILSQQELAHERHRLQLWEERLTALQAELQAQAADPTRSAAALALLSSGDSPSGSPGHHSDTTASEGASPAAATSAEERAVVRRAPSVLVTAAVPCREHLAASLAAWLSPVAEQEENTVVIDNGTFMLRAGRAAGFDAAQLAPHALRNRTASIVEHIDEDSLLTSYVKGSESSRPFFDKKQEARKKAVGLLYSVQDTVLVNYDNAETIYQHLYEKLALKPSGAPLIMTVSDFITTAELERMTEWLFETMGVKDLGYISQSVAALYSAGLHTGISVDLGYSSTRVIACYGGSVIAKRKIPLGWHHLQDAIQGAVVKHYHQADVLPNAFFDELARKAIYVAPAFEQELKDFQSHAIEPSLFDVPIPKVDPVNLTIERFRIGESYFKPSHLGVSSPGLQHTIRALGVSLFSERSKFQTEMNQVCSNIVLSGGGSQIPGLWSRLEAELADSSVVASSSTSFQPSFHLLPSYDSSDLNTWIGAMHFSRSQGGKNRITKHLYDELGPVFLERAFW